MTTFARSRPYNNPSAFRHISRAGRTSVAAAILFFFTATSAQAVSLVVMNVATSATNSAIPAGEQVVTFGIQVKSSDLVGAGTNPVLVVQYLTFAGDGLVPVQATPGGANKVDIQSVQSSVIDVVATNNAAPATQADLTANQQASVYADSWWYNSSTGVLQGVIDSSGDVGTVSDPTWQLGPVQNVGPTGFTWTPQGTPGVQAGNTVPAALASLSGTNATTGQFMMYTGLYAPPGSGSLTSSPLAGQFVNGLLTVPIA